MKFDYHVKYKNCMSMEVRTRRSLIVLMQINYQGNSFLKPNDRFGYSFGFESVMIGCCPNTFIK